MRDDFTMSAVLSAIPNSFRQRRLLAKVEMGHVWTAPAVQGKRSDFFAKRSGAAMYPTCFRLEACLHAMRPLWPLALM
jgi:hypothetical protein